MHRPSIVGPVVLLSFGVIALLITSGKLSAPILLGVVYPLVAGAAGGDRTGFAAGVVSRSRPALPPQDPAPSASSCSIFILVGIGYSQRHVSDWSRQIGRGDPGNWPNFMGEEHDHDADSSVSIPANASVQVQNPRGDVTITGSGDNLLHVHAHQVVHTNSDGDANNTFPALDPKITVNGSNVLVKVEGRPNGRADLTIELPEGASTDITAGRGDVSVEGLKGASNVTASNGDVKLSSMGASIHVHMNKGDFSAHEIAGSVALDGHVSDVTVSEVGGSLAMDGEFFGDTHLEQIASNVHFHSSRTELDLAQAGRRLDDGLGRFAYWAGGRSAAHHYAFEEHRVFPDFR